MKVLIAAPFCPLSSFNTCIKITWFGFITSCILYLFDLNLGVDFFESITGNCCEGASFVKSSSFTTSSEEFNSISDSDLTSTGSLISKLPSLIFFSSSFSLSF